MPLNTIKVYFDGNCGLCSKEINYYNKIIGNFQLGEDAVNINTLFDLQIE